MATLGELSKGDSGPIRRIELELDEGLPHRFLYGTPGFIGWLENVLPDMKTGLMLADISPFEQVYERFRQYVVGENLDGDRRFAPLICDPETFVWELKTIDVRIFGWVPKMDHFICCFGGHADFIKQHKLYGGFIGQVDHVRSGMNLDTPKSVEFRNYENVLSDAPGR